jgi:UDPglucose 6-dehydrogenase
VLWVTFDTPVDARDVADVKYVEKRIISIIKYLPRNAKVIISSQVPVGFTGYLEKIFAKKIPDKHVICAYSPENLRLGKAIEAFKYPDRIVVGIRDQAQLAAFSNIFKQICERVEWMKIESAEMTKHAINSFLAMSVAFANELAALCESVQADAREVERGLKTETRIGPKAYLGAGLPFAGGTLARDINFLIMTGRLSKRKTLLLNAVKRSNQYHKGWIRRKCLELFRNLKNVRFAVLGLTYKVNTNTLRRSFAVELCRWLHKNGARVKAYDPQIQKLPANLNKIVSLKDNLADALSAVDCLIIGTPNPVFKEFGSGWPVKKREKMKIIDPTGFLDNSAIDKKGIKRISVGRGEC